MLTTGVDTVPGTAGRDKITGGVSTLSSADTLQPTDQIDAGGGRDTADLTVAKDFNGFTIGTGFMKNVETVNLTNTAAVARTFSMNGVSGVETVNVSGPINVTGLSALSTKVNISGVAESLDISVRYADELVSGTSDAASVGLLGNNGSAPLSTAPFNPVTRVNLVTPGIETLNLAVSGTNYASLEIGTATTSVRALNVTGSGTLHLGAATGNGGVSSALKTIDASAFTGATVVNLSNATAVTSVKTGSGNDTIIAFSGDLAGNAVVDGGGGTNTLHLVADAAHTAAYALKGVQTLSILGSLGTTAGAGAITLSGANSTGIENISIGNTYGGTAAITGLGSSAVNVRLVANSSTVGGNDRDATVTVGNTGAATLTMTVPATATSNQTINDTVTFSTSPSLTVSLPKFASFTGQVLANAAKSVTISGAGSFSNAWANTTTGHGLRLPAADTLIINQSDPLAAWLVGVDRGTATSSALRTLDVTNKGTVTLSGNTTGSAFADLTNIKVNTDTAFTLNSAGTSNAFTKLTSLEVSGSATGDAGSSFTVGALGATDLAYGITVVASGLRGTAGLVVGNINVGSGQAISVDLTGRAGSRISDFADVTVANATSGDRTGSININAKGSAATGTIDFRNLQAKTVTYDVSGSQSAQLDIGTIAGDTIVVKGNSAATTFNVGAITVKNSLTFHGAELASANGDTSPLTINHNAPSTGAATALTVDLKGSILSDQFVINGGAATSAVTVTGDLGAGGTTDRVTIDGSARTSTTGGMTISVSDLISSGGTLTTSIIGGRGNDTITGSSKVDTIIGGLGGDVLRGNGGNDVFWLNNPSDTGSVLTTSGGVAAGITVVTPSTGANAAFSRSYVFAANDKISTSTFDKIMDFSTGDRIITNAASDPTTAANIVVQAIGSAFGLGARLSDGTVVTTAVIDSLVRGSYDPATGEFTFKSSGATDTLYIFDASGDTSGNDLHAVVLVGYTGIFEPAASGATVTGLIGATAS